MQWTDVVGLLKTGWTALDQRHLERWADALGVADLLDQARAEARPETD